MSVWQTLVAFDVLLECTSALTLIIIQDIVTGYKRSLLLFLMKGTKVLTLGTGR